jgi:hypothetical protein
MTKANAGMTEAALISMFLSALARAMWLSTVTSSRPRVITAAPAPKYPLQADTASSPGEQGRRAVAGAVLAPG